MSETTLDSGLIVPFTVPAYPPPVPPDTRVNTTPQTDNHPGDHNALADGMSSIINELGTGPKGTYSSLTARLTDLALGPPAWSGFFDPTFGITGTAANYGIVNFTSVAGVNYILITTAFFEISSVGQINIYPAIDSVSVGHPSFLKLPFAGDIGVSITTIGWWAAASAGAHSGGIVVSTNSSAATIGNASAYIFAAKKMN